MHIACGRREIIVMEKTAGGRAIVRIQLLRRLINQWLIALLLLRQTIQGACQLLAKAQQMITVLALVIRRVVREGIRQVCGLVLADR